MVKPNTDYKLIRNDNSDLFTSDKINEINTGLSKGDKININIIRPPHANTAPIQTRITKSFVWWSDDPFAALIALAAISILLSIVGIIVIIFTSSRYVYIYTYIRPEFLYIEASFTRDI